MKKKRIRMLIDDDNKSHIKIKRRVKAIKLPYIKSSDYLRRLQEVEKISTPERLAYAKETASKYGIKLETFKHLTSRKTYYDYKTGKRKPVTKTMLNKLAKRAYQLYTGFYEYKKERNYYRQWEQEIRQNVGGDILYIFREIVNKGYADRLYQELKDINFFYITLKGRGRVKMSRGEKLYSDRVNQIINTIQNIYVDIPNNTLRLTKEDLKRL